MARKKLTWQSGVTTDGRPVVAGLYAFYETHGVALGLVVEALHARGAAPDWADFYHAARAAGVGRESVREKVRAAVAEVHGPGASEYAFAALDLLEAGG